MVFINFYADWCRFSQILQPIFDEAAVKLEAEFPGKVLLAKVDCDAQSTYGVFLLGLRILCSIYLIGVSAVHAIC